MTINARNAGRIDVWPSSSVARDADTSESKVFGRMTVWPTSAAARDHLSLGGGGGRDAFAAQAVQFDGFMYLVNDGLASADSPLMGFSIWLDGLVTVDPKVLFFVEENPVVTISNCAFLQFDNTWINFGGTGVSGGAEWRVDNTVATGGVHHLMGAWDTNHPVGEKLAALYIDDVYVPIRRSSASAPAFTMTLNGVPCSVGSLFGGSPYTGAMAELWIDRGVSWIDENGRIPTATRRKFINSNLTPVDLGVDGSTPTSASPMIYLSGDATAFATNKGTEPFTLTGGGALTDADDVEPLVAPAGLPNNTVAPVVTGTAQVGQTLTCTQGTWTGTAPIIYSYDWISSPNADPLGETSNTVVITSDMGVVGETIRCIVRASNSVWTNLSFSNETDPVAP